MGPDVYVSWMAVAGFVALLAGSADSVEASNVLRGRVRGTCVGGRWSGRELEASGARARAGRVTASAPTAIPSCDLCGGKRTRIHTRPHQFPNEDYPLTDGPICELHCCARRRQQHGCNEDGGDESAPHRGVSSVTKRQLNVDTRSLSGARDIRQKNAIQLQIRSGRRRRGYGLEFKLVP